MAYVIDYFKPTQSKLSGLAKISEERSKWVKGRLIADKSVSFEISFESAPSNLCFPETYIPYFGFWRPQRKALMAEFSLGQLVGIPTEADWVNHVRPLMVALRYYQPIMLAYD